MWLKIIFRGGLGLRPEPRADSSTSQVLAAGTVVEATEQVVDGENIFVKLKNGGWIYAKKDGRELVREVQGPKTLQGCWMYRVTNSGGMRFALSASADADVARSKSVTPAGSIVRGIERHVPAGSSVTSVKLENAQGWVFEATNTAELLDRFDDLPVLEHFTPERHTFTSVWVCVCDPQGVHLYPTPARVAPVAGLVFPMGKIFETCETLQYSNEVYHRTCEEKLWVLGCAGDTSFVTAVSGPLDENVTQWLRVMFPGGIACRAEPSMSCPKSEVVIPRGGYICAKRRRRFPGSRVHFLQISSAVCCAGGCPPERAQDLWVFDAVEQASGVTTVLDYVDEPFVDKRKTLMRVIYPGGVALRTAPDALAPKSNIIVPNYETVEVDMLFGPKDGSELLGLLSAEQRFVNMDYGSQCPPPRWLICRLKSNNVAEKVDAGPIILTGITKYMVKRPDVPYFRGPHSAAPVVGTVSLPPGSVIVCDRRVSQTREGTTHAKLERSGLYVLVEDAGSSVDVDTGLENISEAVDDIGADVFVRI